MGKFLHKAIAASVGVALVAVASGALAQASAGPEKKVYSTPIPALWSGDPAKGPIVYKPLNLTFPEKLGKFERFRVAGIEGRPDFWVNYELKRPQGDIRLTVFLFKPDSSMPEHTVTGSISSFGMASAGAMSFVWSDGPRNIAVADRSLQFFKGTYKTGIGPNTVMDYLYFADLGTWRVKVRATLPSPADSQEEADAEAAIAALDWKAILAANGQCTGKACSADAPTVFNSHMGEMLLSQVIQSGQGKKISGDAGAPLFSRKVGDTQWEVHPLDPRINELFTKGYGALSVSTKIYTLSWKQGGKAGVVRFFSGEPDEAMVSREIDRLTQRPEKTIFVPIADAAYYAAD